MKELNYESLTLVDRKHIHEALAETTLKHINSTNGLLEPMPFDLAASPSQRLEVTHLEPAMTSKEEAAQYAKAASEIMGSPNLSDSMKETLKRQRSFLSVARLMLDNGVNIYPVTNHTFIADVAYWSEAWASELGLDEKHWQEQNGLIISRGVTTIKAFDMAASELLQKAGHVFMSFPRTKTIEDLGIDSKIIKTNNGAMLEKAKKWLNHGVVKRIGSHVLGKTLHMAWSGKTDIVRYGDNHKPDYIEISKVTNGTSELFKKGLVLPVVIWDGKGEYEDIVELGELTVVDNLNDAHRVQQWQAETLAERLEIPKDKVIVN